MIFFFSLLEFSTLNDIDFVWLKDIFRVHDLLLIRFSLK